MKHHPAPPAELPLPTDDDIRDYACHLYVLSGRIPGRDLDNWLEAEASLKALPHALLAPLRRDARRFSHWERHAADLP
jgi:hypothetical protein